MLSIRNPEDAEDIVSAIKHFYSNRLHTDFCFISRDGQEKYPVHRLIVAMSSPELAPQLYRNNPIKFLQLKYDDTFALRNLINFLYDEPLVLDSISLITQTKAIADRYRIEKLGEICKRELINVPVSTANVLSVLERAREFKNEKKERECLILISENQDAVFESHEFLGLSFRRVLDIFQEIKTMTKMTDAGFLNLALRWLDKNGNKNSKDLLMEKVNVTSLSLEEYRDIIIEYPDFFSNIEISYTVKQIKSQSVAQNVPKITQTRNEKRKEYRNAESNTDFVDTVEAADVEYFKKELHKEQQKNLDWEGKYDHLFIASEAKNIEMERKIQQIKDLESTVKRLREKAEATSPTSSLPYSSIDSKQKHLNIQVLDTEDGVNIHEAEKRARITVQEGSIIRSIQVPIADVLKQGLIGTVADKKGSFSESDVDLSYEGVYFMLRSLKQLDETLSPIQYIEVLKAALCFQLKGLAEQCIKRISGIVDYDPVFLDGLRTLSYLKDKCLGLKGLSEFKDKYTALLLSEPLRVILHPNFTKCSVNLIIVLLEQVELKVKDESQLLIVVIAWLEAQKEDRRLFRMTLLKQLAFQNVSTADFRYIITHYPNFFDEKEQKLVLAYRNAVGSEIKFFRDNLPEWYTSKTRKHI